ncbi:ABC transporter permease [Schleiferilactobacillus perolens]|jgi:putative aldouronate transport system permease protein|uniref:Sugar abc transporter, permease protein n=1 Tax=Schleiferilactobacillus perolens DSM 12744 TaxID=1423792 RepID=A0A0R1N9T4_9LACO|nr:ABC transporter permease subunit [Schleiferilactobacillus perolens]KRL13811.1 sugar abc transporter, permease protein [Schleiferilactobacillus perolens DSM 12744]MCI1890517.1 ABC transporter permease subunit [Schleiferilactobacillus harbinensis]MCI1911672.1 ABC transporter permease subunit [Schleiferilactobacillus harbinensis]MCI2171792.1 ABC transporter permease subunit [Schleiferilactobacillus perolens]
MDKATTSTAPVHPKARKNRNTVWGHIWDNRVFFLFVAPGTLFLIVFFYVPVLANIVAFKDFHYSDGGFIASLMQSKWSGFDNFKFFFMSSDFWIVVRNTVGYNLTFLLLNFFFAIFFAVIMSQLRNRRLLKAYQTSMLFPYFLSWAILAYFVYAFLSPDKGVLNSIIKAVGGQPIDWYNDPTWWPLILILLGVWKGIGYNSILYFATIMGIDPAYYDAAMIDGANKWQQIKHIVLPHILPVATLMLILNIGGIFRSDFGLFYLVPKQSPTLINISQTFDTYIYRALAQTNDIGMATAAGLIQSVVGLLLLLTANWIVRHAEPESALF